MGNLGPPMEALGYFAIHHKTIAWVSRASSQGGNSAQVKKALHISSGGS